MACEKDPKSWLSGQLDYLLDFLWYNGFRGFETLLQEDTAHSTNTHWV
jgi:hypothetical protein